MTILDAIAGEWIVTHGLGAFLGETQEGRLRFSRTPTPTVLAYAFDAGTIRDRPRLVPYCHRVRGTATLQLARGLSLETSIGALADEPWRGPHLGELAFHDAASNGTDRYSIALDDTRSVLRMSPMFHAIPGLNFFPVQRSLDRD